MTTTEAVEVPQFVEQKVRRTPERVALDDGESHHSFGEFNARANRVVRKLSARRRAVTLEVDS